MLKPSSFKVATIGLVLSLALTGNASAISRQVAQQSNAKFDALARSYRAAVKDEGIRG